MNNRFDYFWNQIKDITQKLNDDDYHAEWKDKLIENHKPSFVKETFEQQ